MSNISKDLKKKYQQLVKAGDKAFKLLLEQVEKPIDEELSDDKARNAMKAKRECFMNAQTILDEHRKIEAILTGDEIDEDDSEFGGGHGKTRKMIT